MTFSQLARQSHRWLGMFFTLTVIANFIAMFTIGKPPSWLTYLPLAPLAIMIPTGVYLFLRPST